MLPEIDGYILESQLGQGGMSTVWLAEQTNFKRKVALKIMSEKLATTDAFVERFLREARIVASLGHQGIVNVFDMGRQNNHIYLAMELLPGVDLKHRIHSKNVTRAEGVAIVKQVADALSYAHSKHVVHRDIKPANILFREDGSPVLVDFGIARDLDSETQLTVAGTIMGTPHYMSPEQCTGSATDFRSDLYSLAIVLFELLEGRLPYRGDNYAALAYQHTTADIPELSENNAHFQGVINRALAKMPEDRHPSAAELRQAIEDAEVQREAPVNQQPTMDSRLKRVPPRSNESGKPKITTSHALVGVAAAAIVASLVFFGISTRSPEVPENAEALQAATSTPDNSSSTAANVDQATTPLAEEVADDERLRELLTQAKVNLWNGQMFYPAEDSALGLAGEALQLAPESSEAAELEARLINTLVEQIETAARENDTEQVSQGLARLRQAKKTDLADTLAQKIKAADEQ